MNNGIQNTSVEASMQQYRSPEVKVIFVKAHGLLCQSGNEQMHEHDYGDAGFVEV